MVHGAFRGDRRPRQRHQETAPGAARPLRGDRPAKADAVATSAARPSTSRTSRGSQVGSAVGANQTLREIEVSGDQAAASRDADHFQQEVDRKDDEPAAIAASGTNTRTTDNATARAVRRTSGRHE